jgi:hypothetical protein
MGLLDKTNPNATRASVIRSAIIGAVFGPILGLILYRHPHIRPLWAVLLPLLSVLGAGIGALEEWQCDDGGDKPDDEEWAEAFDA